MKNSVQAISQLATFYKGFALTQPRGNNAFSFEKRENRRLIVPELVEGTVQDLAVGELPAFGEVEDGVEFSRAGLARFICDLGQDKTILFFDNHNHAFFFWTWGLHTGLMPRGRRLVHVDQHSDLLAPEQMLDGGTHNLPALQDAFTYTQEDLHVGSFIKPALALDYFSGVDFVDGKYMLGKSWQDGFVLDIDLDFFAPEMRFVPDAIKIERCRELIAQSPFITVATSPYFIDQQLAIDIANKIFAR